MGMSISGSQIIEEAAVANGDSVKIDEEDKYGYGGSLAMNLYIGRWLTFNLFGQGYSEKYINTSTSYRIRSPRLSGRTSLGLNLGFLGSLSLTYSLTEEWEDEGKKSAIAFYSKNITNNINMLLTGSWGVHDGEEQTNVLLGFNYVMEHNRLLSMTGLNQYKEDDSRSSGSLVFQQSTPGRWGLGYKLQADTIYSDQEEGKQETGGRAEFEYKGKYGIVGLTANRQATSESNDFLANLSGGLVLIDKGLHITKPISDGFALVQVGNVEGVEVYYNNEAEGVTNKDGKLILPELLAYNVNSISINPSAVPMDYTLLSPDRMKVTTYYRSGGVVKFELIQFRAFEGNIFFVVDGKKQPAKYAGLNIKVGDKMVEFVTGNGGAFYLENIPPGTHFATVYDDKQSCDFSITIPPESEETIVSMGDLTCEVK